MTRLARIAQTVATLPAPEGDALATVRIAGVDLMGCILAGVDHTFAQQSRAALAGCGGKSPIYGTAQRTEPPSAALCNAVAGHVFDFDDCEAPGNTHPSLVMLPALWAMAAHRTVSGRDVATAYAAGFEVIARLGEAFNLEHYSDGWHSTATLGTIGAAAAVGRLIGLSADRLTHALSLAISQASGYTCQFGSAAKPLQAGFAARDGLTAALLADQGLTGQPRVLDAPTGFAARMTHGDLSRLDSAIDRMNGRALEEWGIMFKAYPSCGYTHRLIDCARELASQVDPTQIAEILAELPDFHAAILPFNAPRSRHEALFSAPFCIATALVRGDLTLADLDEAASSAPEVAKLITMITVSPRAPARPQMNYDPDQPDRLTITLRSGETLTASCSYPRGAPQNPMSPSEVRAKFEAICGTVSTTTLEAWMSWENASDIAPLLEAFGDSP